MPYTDDMMYPQPVEEPTKVVVEESKLREILGIARVGEAQVIPFNKDHGEMAKSAALLSKQKCGEIIEKVLEILTD